MRLLIILLLAIVSVCACLTAAEDIKEMRIDSILVSVNGTPISLMDVLYESRHAEARLAVVHSGKELFDAIRKHRMGVLDELIKRQLILDDYQKKPFDIPNQFIEGMLDDLSQEFNCGTRRELELKAKDMGTSLAELRRKATERLIVQSLIGSYCYRHVNLTPREIHEYYNNNLEKFTIQPQIKMSVIYLKKDRTDYQKALNDIEDNLKKTPEKFNVLAELYTDGPSPEQGGDLGWIDEKSLRKEFKEVLKTLEVGKFSGSITTDEGVYFLYLTGREEGRVKSFEDVGGKLYKEIENELRDEAVKRYVSELKTNAIIRYYR